MAVFLSFLKEDAARFGVDAATILHGLRTFLEHHKAEKHNVRDGYVWNYASVKGLAEYYGIFTEHQIRHTLKKLQAAGAIISGEYNDNPFKRTKWYSMPEFCVNPIEAKAAGLPVVKPHSLDLGNFPSGGETHANSTFGKFPKSIDNNKTIHTETINNTSLSANADISQRSNQLELVPVELKNDPIEQAYNLYCSFVKEYNEKCRDHNSPKLPQPSKLTDARKTSLRKALKECKGVGWEFQQLLEEVGKSDFLMGRKASFRISIEFLAKKDSIVKIFEGFYLEGGRSQSGQGRRYVNGADIVNSVFEGM